MKPRTKPRSSLRAISAVTIKPLRLFDVTNPRVPVHAISLQPIRPVLPASGAANHARHHVAVKSQS